MGAHLGFRCKCNLNLPGGGGGGGGGGASNSPRSLCESQLDQGFFLFSKK